MGRSVNHLVINQLLIKNIEMDCKYTTISWYLIVLYLQSIRYQLIGTSIETGSPLLTWIADPNITQITGSS